MNFLRQIFERPRLVVKRGWPAQQHVRENEYHVRRRVVSIARHYKLAGKPAETAAGDICIPPSLLGCWLRSWKINRLLPVPRGRPIRRASVFVRNEVEGVLEEMGPQTGIPTLRAIFPDVVREELFDIALRYRKKYAAEKRLELNTLYWNTVNAVWALDYTEPPLPIDGLYKTILVIRELTSGMQLAALPFQGESARNTINTLRALFEQYSAPLVIKSDNGKTVAGKQVLEFLDRWKVWHLPSPVRMPKYNGSCEAGNGSVKTRTIHNAAKNGRPGRWTCDDVEQARLQANFTARPRGYAAPTPAQAFRNRSPIFRKQRLAFDNAVNMAINMLGKSSRKEVPGIPKNSSMPANFRRKAVREALVTCGFLSIRRMSFSTKKNGFL